MALTLDKKEMLRYWGIKGKPSQAELEIAKKAGQMALDKAMPKNVYNIFDCCISGNNITIGQLKIVSIALAKRLKDCNKAIMLAATVGIGIDELINRYNGIDMALSTAISAAGSALIETYLDEITQNMKKELKIRQGKCRMTPRFSPGYADLSLDLQTDFFSILNITRRIGVSLNDSLLMTPTKSVTAIIGIRNDEDE